jgi:hypothetical protein
VPVINLATEPVKAAHVARACFEMEFTNKTEKPPVFYDMRTRFARLFGRKGSYLYSKEEIYDRIRRFIKTEKESLNT